MNYEAIVDFAGNAKVHEDSISVGMISKAKKPQEIKDYPYQRAEEVFEQKKAHLNSQEQLLWNLKKVVILRVVDYEMDGPYRCDGPIKTVSRSAGIWAEQSIG